MAMFMSNTFLPVVQAFYITKMNTVRSKKPRDTVFGFLNAPSRGIFPFLVCKTLSLVVILNGKFNPIFHSPIPIFMNIQ